MSNARELNIGQLLRIPFQHLMVRHLAGLAARGFADIRLAHSQVLQHIDSGGVRLTALAERAQLTKGTVSPVVEELVRLGYLRYDPDPTDGRAKLIHRTEQGERLTAAAEEAMAELQAEWTAALGDRNMRVLRRLLGRLAGVSLSN